MPNNALFGPTPLPLRRLEALIDGLRRWDELEEKRRGRVCGVDVTPEMEPRFAKIAAGRGSDVRCGEDVVDDVGVIR